MEVGEAKVQALIRNAWPAVKFRSYLTCMQYDQYLASIELD